MQGNLIGLILSILATLVIAVSFYWAVTTNKTHDVTTFEYKTVDNRSQVAIDMTKENSASWGTVPGNFDSNLIDSVNIQYYSEDFLSSKSVTEMLRKVEAGADADSLVKEHFSTSQNVGQKTSSATVAISRTINPFFDMDATTDSNMVYTPSIKNNPIAGYNENQTLPTINYEALNLWWQMQNLPTFLQAWQVFSQNTNKMLRQNFQDFYYTHMMWSSGFQNQTWLNDTLFSFDPVNVTAPETQNATTLQNNAWIEGNRTAIYNDLKYGMNTEGNLTIWISATMGNTVATTELKKHYFSGSVLISDYWFANLTNSDSMIMQNINASNDMLVQLKIFNETDITLKNMVAQQWAQGNLLNNSALCVNATGCETMSSVKSLDMSFMAMPEITQSGCDVTFDRFDAEELFEQNLEGAFPSKTLLNAKNYFDFQEMVETAQWTAIKGRFGLDQDKASCLFSYASQQAAYAPYQAYGNMLTDGIRQSQIALHDFFPINLAARTMAYRLDHNVQEESNADGNDYCLNMVHFAVPNVTRVTEICTGQNFTNVDNLQAWIDPFWFGNYGPIMAQTNMTQDELDVFYSSTNSSFFGARLDSTLLYNFNKYSCPSAVDEYPTLTLVQNCSATFIANDQWGRSDVTLNPPYMDEDYFPTGTTSKGTQESLSVTDWGVPGIGKSPEYFYYSQFHYAPFTGAQNPPPLDAWQVGNITDNHYSYYGIGNTYNAKQLYYNYVTNSHVNEKPYISATMVQWELNSPLKVYAVLGCLDWLIQDYVLGGLTSTYTMKEMVFGWQSGLVSNISFSPTTNYTSRHYRTGDAIYYAKAVTPFLQGNSWSMSPSNTYVTVSTGNLYPITTGRIMKMNQYEYPNILMNVNDGMGSSNLLPFRCSKANFTIDNVYSWQQGMPGNINAPNITTLNTMNMQLQKQYYATDEVLCENGTDSQCLDSYNQEYNSYTQNIYNRTSDYVPVDNCGTRIFSHGTGTQSTTIDVRSGMSTTYMYNQSNTLSWNSLTSPHPNGSGDRVHLHPFPSLKVLYDKLGATISVNLGGSKSTFQTSNTAFVATQYPASTTYPTKQVQIPVTNPVTERCIVIFMVVIYSLLLVFTMVLAIGFGVNIHKAKAAETQKANHVLYDNLNPTADTAAPETE